MTLIFFAEIHLIVTLIIDHVYSSCGCTRAMAPSIVPAGANFIVRTTLSVGPEPAQVRSSVSVSGHCGQRPVDAKYTMQATALPILVFPGNNEFVNMGSASLHQKLTVEIPIVRGEYPLAFDELHAKCDSSLISLKVIQRDNDHWQMNTTLNSTNDLGTLGCPVVFTFSKNGTLLPEKIVKQVFASISGPIMATPHSVLLTSDYSEHLQKTVQIEKTNNANDTTPLTISGVWTTSKNAKVDFVKRKWQKFGNCALCGAVFAND